jgi:hypothetical protein
LGPCGIPEELELVVLEELEGVVLEELEGVVCDDVAEAGEPDEVDDELDALLPQPAATRATTTSAAPSSRRLRLKTLMFMWFIVLML